VRACDGRARVSSVVALALVLWVALPLARRLILRPEASESLRGREVATRLGCFACHGGEGRGGVSNPGSQHQTIPAFTGSTLMMYVHDDAEIRQYVLDGRPDRLADDAEYRAAMEAQAIRMPAYRGRLNEQELDQLVAYIRQISGMIAPPGDPAASGVDVAQRMGCFGCHGPLGMGGRENPRSLKGYIPGFLGDDFRELVRDDGELHDWIRHGKLERIEHHWIGGWFSRRQQIQMPAYEQRLTQDELEGLVALIHWIQQDGVAKEKLQ
jgi:mono/diheme cytochrome c family protein